MHNAHCFRDGIVQLNLDTETCSPQAQLTLITCVYQRAPFATKLCSIVCGVGFFVNGDRIVLGCGVDAMRLAVRARVHCAQVLCKGSEYVFRSRSRTHTVH